MTVIRKKGAKILMIVMELLEMTKIANQRIMMKVVMTKTKVAAMMKKKIAVKAVAMKKMRKRKKNMAVIPVKAMMGIINQGGKIRMIKKRKAAIKMELIKYLIETSREVAITKHLLNKLTNITIRRENSLSSKSY